MVITKEIIDEKLAHLKKIGSVLKSRYFGIDEVIDQIIESIKSWYIFDELLYMPTVINLWSMTGQGKTAMIRDLIKLLDYVDKSVNIDVSKNVGHYTTSGNTHSVEMSLLRVLDSPLNKGILVVDEIHNLAKNESDPYKLSDIWSLLGTGMINNTNHILLKFDRMIKRLDDIVIKFNSTNIIHEDEEDEKDYKSKMNPIISPIISNPYLVEDVAKLLNIESFDDLCPLFDFIDFNSDSLVLDSQYGIGFGARYKIENLIKCGQIELSEVLNIPGIFFIRPIKDMLVIAKQKYLDKITNMNNTKDPLVFSKLLIFNLGNLDELYTSSGNSEISVEDLYEETSKLTLNSLKQSLLKIFKPEHVSRFGNNHIIYKSFTRKNYEDIIRYNLKLIERDVFEISELNIDISNDLVVEYFYKESIIATQGVRPILSKIHSTTSRILPKIVGDRLSNKIERPVIDYITELI